jgi:hypothetical protein
MLSGIVEKKHSSRSMHRSSTFLPQVFHRAVFLALVLAFLPLDARAQTVDLDAYSRVFLQNGRALPSYGESTLVGDRVAFVLPIGDPRGRVELQLVSLPVSAVDVARTARYVEGARARSYAVTRAASDYSALMADVSLTLAEIDKETDRARRLTVAGELRARIVAWPVSHYNYRAADLVKVLETLDQLVTEIQRDLGQTPSTRPPLRTAPVYDSPLPLPTPQESFDLAIAAGLASADAGVQQAIDRIVRSMAPVATTGTTGTTGTAVAAPTRPAAPVSRPAQIAAAPKAAPVPITAPPKAPPKSEAPPETARQVAAPAAEAVVASPAPAAAPVVVPPPAAEPSAPPAGLTLPVAPAVLVGVVILLIAGAAGLAWGKHLSGTTGTAEDLEGAGARHLALEEVVAAKPRATSPVVPVVPVAPVAPVVPVVEVGDVRDTRQYGYHFVEGVVRNVSDRTLHYVEVIVDWCAPSGELFTRETALIGLDALAPGNTSPFKVLTRANPSMTSYSLVFQSEGATLAQFRPASLQ